MCIRDRLNEEIYEEAVYLFTIDEERFYLVQNISRERLSEFTMENKESFRYAEPQYLAFAGITGYQLNNLSSSYLKTGFKSREYLSDYYVENASFLKMDNLSLNYNFGQICKGCSLNVSAMVQNVFCITKYSGVDPEVPNGVDNSFYPRPRTFSLNVGFNF